MAFSPRLFTHYLNLKRKLLLVRLFPKDERECKRTKEVKAQFVIIREISGNPQEPLLVPRIKR